MAAEPAAVRAGSRAGARVGRPAVVAGERAVAGLAGLLLAVQEPFARAALGLDSGSRVLLFGTEGATDPEVYARLVGHAPSSE